MREDLKKEVLKHIIPFVIDEAKDLYLKGYTVLEILEHVKHEWGVGYSEVYEALAKLPKEYKVKHLEGLINRRYEIYKEIMGEEKAKHKIELLKQKLLSNIG